MSSILCNKCGRPEDFGHKCATKQSAVALPCPGSAAWYRKQAEEARYNGKTVSQYNHFLSIAEAIELTQRECQQNVAGEATASKKGTKP